MADLTAEDINVLIEALDAWKDKDAVVEFFDQAVEHLSGHTGALPRQVFAQRQGRAAAKAVRKEQAIVLQAKLIEMRMRLEGGHAMNDRMTDAEWVKERTRTWIVAPGRWNAVRWWLRCQFKFSTYYRYLAPVIGWPKVIPDDKEAQKRNR